MKTGKQLVLLCLFAFALITCKKEILQPGNTVGTPTFYFNGTVNGTAVNLTAGINDYYMYSSYTQDANNVYNFTANLHPTNCSNCPNSIQFIINDNNTSSNGASVAVRIDSSLKPATYPFLTPLGGAPTTYSINYTPTTGGPDLPNGYYYKFSDGTTATTTSPSISHVYTNPGQATVALTATFVGGHTDSITNVLQIDTLSSLQGNLSFTNAPTTNFYDSLAVGTPPYKIQWNFGDGTVLAPTSYPTNNNSKLHTYTSPGIYQVTVTAIDAKGKTNVIVKKANPFGTSVDYIANLATDSLYPTPNPMAFSNITVVYTDAAGNAYSSANATQLPSSAFQITTVSSYENNVNGQSTKMLHIKFNCQLKDAGGQTITINNGDAVIAVAYK